MTKYLQQLPINRICFWINVFIPGDIPGITRVVPDGPYRGKTMVPHPAAKEINFIDSLVPPKYGGKAVTNLREAIVPVRTAGYLTDQRSFSPNPKASSRMHSLATILLNGIYPQLTQKHWSDTTVEVNVDTGRQTCRTTAKEWTDGTCDSWYEFACTDAFAGTIPGFVKIKKKDIYRNLNVEENLLKLFIETTAGDPCTVLGQLIGKIDYSGEILIDLDKMRIRFNGTIGDVPAYEMYAQVDNGPTKLVFKEPMTSGANFTNLIGGAKKAKDSYWQSLV